MTSFSDTQETSCLFDSCDGYIEQVQHVLRVNHVPFGTPFDFLILAQTLEHNSQLRTDLTLLLQSFVEGERKMTHRTALGVIAVASGGSDFTPSANGKSLEVSGMSQPVNVLVEGGLAGARCGVRDVATAVEVAAAVRAAAPHLALTGVEGFEGLARATDGAGRERVVREFLAFLIQIAVALDERDLFDTAEVLLSAGGSAFFDVVADVLTGARLSRPTRVMLRSGCYLSEDYGLYARALDDLHKRTGSPVPALEPALEVWAQVLSVPEPGLVILSAGRRDFGQDAGNPVALTHVPRGTGERRSLRDAGWTMAAASDQHAHMAVPENHGVAVGDLVALGPSHPCTTFDKWRTLYLVDDDYTVTEAVPTFF